MGVEMAWRLLSAVHDAVRHGARAAWRELCMARAIRAGGVWEHTQTLPIALDKRYILTANSGVYRLEGNTLHRLFRYKAYGIALDDTALFLAVHCDAASLVLRLDRSVIRGARARTPPRVLFSQIAQDPSDRLHALHLAPDGGLLIANTARNTIVEIDRTDGTLRREVPPFQDAFGTPLYYNVNHINSVSCYGDAVLFVANRAGARSLIGVLDDAGVTGYVVAHAGVHDILFSGRQFYYCDTFGDLENGTSHGAPYREQQPVAAEFFRETRCTVRGMAGDPDGEMLIGNSVRGERSKRFTGSGSVLLLRDGEIRQTLTLKPIAQIYQIIQENGCHLDNPPTDLHGTEVRARFQACFGPPAFDRPLARTPVVGQIKWEQRARRGGAS